MQPAADSPAPASPAPTGMTTEQQQNAGGKTGNDDPSWSSPNACAVSAYAAAPTPEATAPDETCNACQGRGYVHNPLREACKFCEGTGSFPHAIVAPEATGAPEPDCLTAGDGSCIDARPCIHTPRDDAQDRADELDGYASLTVEDRDWIEHLITTDGDWIPGVPERFLRRYEATLVRLEATVAALTADNENLELSRDRWEAEALRLTAERGAERSEATAFPVDPISSCIASTSRAAPRSETAP